MNVDFVVDKEYLIAHTLYSMEAHRFSSLKHAKDIVAFQNFAWEEDREQYDFLIGRKAPLFFSGDARRLSRESEGYLSRLQKSKEFATLLDQTLVYREVCEKQWEKNLRESLSFMQEMTGFDFDQHFTAYLTHPSLRNGRFLGKRRLAFGHAEVWPNYFTVYVWHEILHGYLRMTEQEHALIQFLADNGLRVHLNGGTYPPFEGHEHLFVFMERMLPVWKNYVSGGKRDFAALRKSFGKQRLRGSTDRGLSL